MSMQQRQVSTSSNVRWCFPLVDMALAWKMSYLLLAGMLVRLCPCCHSFPPSLYPCLWFHDCVLLLYASRLCMQVCMHVCVSPCPTKHTLIPSLADAESSLTSFSSLSTSSCLTFDLMALISLRAASAAAGKPTKHRPANNKRWAKSSKCCDKYHSSTNGLRKKKKTTTLFDSKQQIMWQAVTGCCQKSHTNHSAPYNKTERIQHVR